MAKCWNHNKTISLGSTVKCGLYPLENKLWSGLLVKEKQSDPKNRQTRLYHSVWSVIMHFVRKAAVFVMLISLKMNRGST